MFIAKKKNENEVRFRDLSLPLKYSVISSWIFLIVVFGYVIRMVF